MWQTETIGLACSCKSNYGVGPEISQTPNIWVISVMEDMSAGIPVCEEIKGKGHLTGMGSLELFVLR